MLRVCIFLLASAVASAAPAHRASHSGILPRDAKKAFGDGPALVPGQQARAQALRVMRGGAISRNPPPPAGSMSAAACITSLTKNIIGAGMLALPAGMAAGKGTGVLPALAIVLFSGALSTYTFNLVGRCVDATGAVDFRELWSLTVGSSSAWVVDFMILGVAAGATLVYSCFLGDIVASLAGQSLSRTQAILSATAVLTPLCLLPDLSALAPAAYAGVAAVFYSAWFIIKRFLDGSCALGGALASSLPVPPELGQVSSGRVSLGTCVLFNMLSTAFMAHTNGVRFYNELEGRTPAKFSKCVTTGFMLSAAFYGLVMLAGYKTFGAASQGLILNNYATSDNLAKLGRAATGVSILGSYPLLFTSLRDVIISSFKSSPLLSSLGARCSAASSPSWIALSLTTLAAVTATAIATSDVGFVVSVPRIPKTGLEKIYLDMDKSNQ